MAALRSLVLPFVLLVAGCSKKQPSHEAAGSGAGSGSAAVVTQPSSAAFVAEWNVNESNGACLASKHEGCPPDVACDPPAPRAIACPAGTLPGSNARVVELADRTCAVAPIDCKGGPCLGAKTACPLPQGEVLPPLAWAVTPMADGSCRASSSTPGAATAYVTIKCPGTATFIRRADAAGPCVAEQEGKPAGEVPCPVEPKQYTVAALREAFAKDRASVHEQRVRISGFNVFANAGTIVAGKTTTYSVGASDAKDGKLAIKCFSAVAPPELGGGDPVLLEGVVKGSAPADLVLTECVATLP
ncbi:MAG: hypothetical protein M3680_08710 [Myxococcota bacterium]|nr:hypothetical protein [Myxococcota bacterium]